MFVLDDDFIRERDKQVPPAFLGVNDDDDRGSGTRNQELVMFNVTHLGGGLKPF